MRLRYSSLVRHYPLALLLLFSCAWPVQAANKVLLWPIDPVITHDQHSSSLWIENQGDKVAMMQVRILGWQQKAGDEAYSNQQDVVASPPIVQIEPGNKQLIRLIKQTEPPADQEVAYRILVDEIPQSTAKNSNTAHSQLQFQMRYSLPLFVYGKDLDYKGSDPATAESSRHQPRLSWQLERQQGKVFLQVTNQGNIHARLSHLSFLPEPRNRQQIAGGLFGYVLANSSRRWPVEVDPATVTALMLQVNKEKPARFDKNGAQ